MKKLLASVFLFSFFSANVMANDAQVEKTGNINPTICASAQLNKDSNNMDGSDVANYLSCKRNNMIEE